MGVVSFVEFADDGLDRTILVAVLYSSVKVFEQIEHDEGLVWFNEWG